MQILKYILITLLLLNITNCRAENKEELKMTNDELDNYSQITLGAGCFWCVEAVFQRLEGVKFVESGYTNGQKINPTYEEVCSGNTGHAEVARVYYDDNKITLEEILEVFFKTHDPTTLNRQGNDVGTQYRSGIYYHNEKQKEKAERVINEITKAKIYDNKIVTEVMQVENYSKAENYHQNYYNNNKNQPYCAFVINPKIEKLEKLFKDKLKKK